MDLWPEFVAAAVARYGVADVELAEELGIAPHRFYRRTDGEGWRAPAERVRVHPSARPSLQATALSACLSTTAPAAASLEMAAWLHGLRSRPPNRASAISTASTRLPALAGLRTQRARWLCADDIVVIRQVPTLEVPAMLVSLAGRPADQLWGYLIDAVHRRLTTPGEVLERLRTIGPVAGRGRLRELCERLEGQAIESRFQDDVAEELERLGYRPTRSTVAIETPDGIGVTLDIALLDWKVAVEPEGDTFHSTREQRRLDRRRAAAIAGTDWVCVPVDWRDWHRDRPHVLAAIDAAITRQRRRGVGADVESPRPAS